MTKIITEPKVLYGLLAMRGIEVMILVFASDDEVWISWKYEAEEGVQNLRHIKEVIGAHVTAGAMIYLYPYLDRLRENVIYCDMGSVIHFQPKELRPLEATWEFVSCGPMSYA